MFTFECLGDPIIIASHPRSGTHLTIDLLRKQFSVCQSYKLPIQPLDRLYLALEALSAPPRKSISESKAINILKKTKVPIIKTHADPTFSHLDQKFQHWQHWLSQRGTTLYIIRDGRAVMCSLHLFMQSYDPKTRCSLSEFLRQTVNGHSRIKQWANHVELWLAHPNVHVVRFEDIINQTHSTLTKLSQILVSDAQYFEPLLPKPILSRWHSRWLRFCTTKPESSAIIGYYNRQTTLKWQCALTVDDGIFIHQEAGELLNKLGYVENDSWIQLLSSLQ